MRRAHCAWSVLMLLFVAANAQAQSALASSLADVTAQRGRIASAETRVRVDATHRVWAAAIGSPESAVKAAALDLLTEPAGSSSDHIRLPAVYAIAEIANSTDDLQIKTRALGALAEPLRASQVPVRDVAIDAVNSISRGAGGRISLEAVRALAEPVASGNNGVRIPAINALVVAIQGSTDPNAHQAALEVLTKPLESYAAIGGMEVRMMAVAAMERIGRNAPDVATKAKAMGLLQAYAARSSWEAEAKAGALNAAAKIQASIKDR